jgi:hypothetical protein
VHEFYHLFGCRHALTLTACYHKIVELKKHTDAAKGFVPGIDPNGQFLLTRAAVNSRMRLLMAAIDVRSHELTLEQQQDLEWTADCQSKGTVTATPKLQPKSSTRFRVVICVCMDESGTLTQDPVVSVSSGTPKADAAAITLATAASGLYERNSSPDKPAGSCQRTALTLKHTPI